VRTLESHGHGAGIYQLNRLGSRAGPPLRVTWCTSARAKRLRGDGEAEGGIRSASQLDRRSSARSNFGAVSKRHPPAKAPGDAVGFRSRALMCSMGRCFTSLV